MKIEKIRFKNLASLCGEWRIDLTEPVFSDAGIFALSGPVGAGKSTIFDAVRLALYGRTSRLDRVNQNDNEIMTRGAKECFAEVIFSNDKGRFLCRWSQHRATRSNNLQKAQHLLSELKDGSGEGALLTSKLEETRERIRELTGMDFSHFSRAMILPQGQFANFLRATPDERSPILEQITGTGIYAKISRKAHELARGRQLELEALEESCAGIEILSGERIQELQASVRDSRAAVQAIKEQYDAGAEILRVVKSLDSEAENRKRLDAALSELGRELAEAERNCEEAAAQKRRAEAERIVLAPLLLKVRELDTQIAVRRETWLKTSQELEERNRKRLEIEESLRGKELDFRQKQARMDALRDELQKRSADAALGSLLGSVELLCGQIELLERELNESEQFLKTLEKERKKQESALAEAQTALQKQSELCAGAAERFRKKEELLNSLLDSGSIPEFFVKKEAAAGRVRELEEQLARFEEAASLRTQLTDLRKIQETIGKERDSVCTLLNSKNELKNTLEQSAALLEQQRLDRAKIASLEEFRKALVDGRACPLCGSAEHPYAHHLPEPEPDRLPETRRALKKTESEIAALQKAVSLHEIQLGTGEEKRLRLETALEKARSGLSGDRESLTHSLRSAGAELTHLNTVGAMIESAMRDRDQAKTAQEAAQTLSRELSATVETGKNQLANLASRYELAEQARKEKLDRKTELRRSVAGRLDGFGVDSSQPVRALFTGLKQRFAEYEKRVADEKNASAELTRLSVEIQTEKERLANLVADLTARKKTAADQKNALDELSKQRKEFFGERVPAEEEKKSADALGLAEANLHSAEESLQSLRLKSGSLQTSIQESKTRTERAKTFLAGRKIGLPADVAAMETALLELDEQRQERLSAIGENSLLLDQNAKNLERSAALMKQIEAKRVLCRKWALLDDLIGSAEGKKFRLFVQSLTFETLIGLANEQLVKFSDHFILTADPESGLEFNVLDRYRGDEIRSTRNLSGGETFLVSLALALGLSRMTRDRVRIDTLFLDEGFGTLDEETLQHALEQLAGLRQGGKLIGIISHAHGIDSAVPVVLRLENNCGRSTIEGPGVTFLGE